MNIQCICVVLVTVVLVVVVGQNEVSNATTPTEAPSTTPVSQPTETTRLTEKTTKPTDTTLIQVSTTSPPYITNYHSTMITTGKSLHSIYISVLMWTKDLKLKDLCVDQLVPRSIATQGGTVLYDPGATSASCFSSFYVQGQSHIKKEKQHQNI